MNLRKHDKFKEYRTLGNCKSRQILDILGLPEILENLGSLGDLRTLEPLEFSGILETLGSPREPMGVRI